MNQQKRIAHYKQSWEDFRQYCEQRAKDADCFINNKGWHKLREYHLSNYLKDTPSPFSFLFSIKYRHQYLYRQIKCMPKIYHKYINKDLEDPIYKKLVVFPSWKKEN